MKILYAAAEISPFAKMTNTADLLRYLPASLQDKGFEIRILLPKYGSINDRRNRLHEVIRLAGIEVNMEGQAESMKIKVASIPNAKLQVYFLDNDTYFKRKAMFHDPKSNAFYDDNDARLSFYNKGIMETVKRLGWVPDIIHCHDWAGGLVAALAKSTYKDTPNFSNTKVVFHLHSLHNPGTFDANIYRFLDLPADFDRSSIETDGRVDPIRAGLRYADFVVLGNDVRNTEPHATYPDLQVVSERIQGAPTAISSLFADYYRRITTP
jgi:starch synthase